PIIGATVKVKGSSIGTVTDLEGKFSLNTLYGSTLEISYIGYNSQEVKVGERTDLFVVMKENTQNLNELVVIGYGSVKKSDLTGAVSSVNADQLSKSPGFSPVAALQGRVAGVNVELSSGAPDASANIQIRGVGSPNGSTPLFVVDGFPMADINQLNPNDIENMEILKDASACAIYGSRGANGVILITTKKGHSGSTKVTLNASYGIEKLASSPEMLNATQYATLSNLASENAGNSDTYSDVNNLQYNTNWYKQITQTGQYQNYNVSVSGGSDKAQSMFSANYYGRQGLVKSTIFDRITLNENTVFKVADWLKFTSSLSVAANKGRNLNSNSVFLTSIIAPPDIPVIDPSTNYYSGITKIDIANPAGAIARNVGINKHLFVVGNFAVDLNFTKDLIFTSRFGIKVDHENDKSFTPVYYETSDQSTLMNTVSRTTNNVVDWTWENILNYHHLFAEKHDLSLMGAMSSRRYRKDYYSVTKQNIPNNSEDFWYFDAATENPLASGNGAGLSMLSYLGRANYVFDNRYLLTASFRADGSSRFSKQNRWGYFPSFALGWRISEEKFFKNWDPKWFDNAKLRVGYGAIGNENISSYYPYLTPIAQGYYYTIGSSQTRVNGAVPSAIGNENTKWETTKQFDVGLDLGLFNSSLNFTADYYIRQTNDILLDQQIPIISGFSSMIRNVGGMKNTGLEFVTTYNGHKGNFNYTVSGNMSFLQNKVTDLGTSTAIVSGIPYVNELIDLTNALGNIMRSVVGRSYNEFYGYKTDGIFQNQAEIDAYTKDGKLIQPDAKPGDVKYKDVNNDGKIDDNDMTFIGKSVPSMTYGLSFDAHYKAFDLSFTMSGVAGNKIYNATKYMLMRFDGKQNVETKYLYEYWHGEGTSNTIPIPTTDITRNSRNYRNSDFYVEDGSYLRMKNIQFGYTFTPTFKNLDTKIRVYIAAENLFTITHYSGFDPEVSFDLSVDRGQYPQPRTFIIGTAINF
ncbi:MAG: TonB-dependent receptor, partial [Prevotella sp.]|nr:TonB-dependent receptor [Prevotella sp.]